MKALAFLLTLRSTPTEHAYNSTSQVHVVLRGSRGRCHWNPCSSSFERQRAASGDRAAGDSPRTTKPGSKWKPAPRADRSLDRSRLRHRLGDSDGSGSRSKPGPDGHARDHREIGERTAEQFLRNLPVANANSIPLSNNNNGSDTAIGAAGVALRGFDARATLVLIDGRRVAPYPITNSGIAFVDLYSIPRDAIESIEVLKDGASTTYGADAVAGVVNIKLRKDYRGAEVNVEYGNTTEEDSSQFAASLVFGVGNDKTNMTGVLNYYHRNSIANRDRNYSAVPPFLSSNASPYNLQLTNAAVAEAGGR